MPASVKRVAPDAYEEALCLFCRQSAIFEHFARCRAAGLKIKMRELKSAGQQTQIAKESLLIEKQNLGWDDEFEFSKKPAYWAGFELKDGRLSGNYEKLIPICEGMRNVEKVTAKNHFKYEQATLVLSHYYLQKGLYPMRGAWKFRLRNLILPIYEKRNQKKKEEADRKDGEK